MNKFKMIRLFGCMLYLLTISAVLHAQDSGWSVSPYDYRYDMTVYAQLTVDDQVVTDFSNYEVGAFVGNECRGVARMNEHDGNRWLYVRVYSNSIGETVDFRVFSKAKNKAYGTDGAFVFSSGAAVGSPSAPKNLRCYMATYNISARSGDEAQGSVALVGGGEEVIYGASVTATASPVEGHSFVDWTNEGTVVSSDNPYYFKASQNLDLVANFKVNNYDVVFDVDGVKTTSSLEYGSVITAPANPEKEGYTFAGWSPSFVEGTTVPVGGAVYTATWEINKYDVVFDVDGVLSSSSLDYGSVIPVPTNPEKEGYTFAGWNPAFVEGTTVPVSGKKYTATWTINQYKVRFVVDGVESATTQDYGSAIVAPADPEKEGYTFTGWSPAYVEGVTVPASDVTYTATWTVNKYTFTFDSNGGSPVESLTQDYGTSVASPAAPVREGYTFAGWDKDIPSAMPASDMTFTASWTINQYKVRFVVDGTAAKEETLDYGSAIVAPADPEKEGYTFTGWSPAYVEGVTVPASDVTYTATWTVNKYTFTFDSNGGSPVESLTQDYGTSVAAPAAPEREGYTFAGWDKEIPSAMPASDMTFTASWTINQYKVRFVVDGTAAKEETLDYGSAIVAPADPEKEGYTFTGWSPAYVEGVTVPASDVTYTATWTVNKYTFTFDSNGGSPVESLTQDYGTSVASPAAPEREGYTFAGWDKDIPSAMPASDMTFTASWTINQYKVRFVVDGVESATTQDYGSAIVAPADPEKEGYTFTGWSPAFVEGATVPASDVTYTATWTVNKYTFTFDSNGGSPVESLTQDYGTSITAPVAPEREGYTFAGWDKDIPAAMPASDMTFTASWTINQYKVRFVVDGTAAKEETLDYGSAIVAPADPEKEGYTFTGWSPAYVEGATVPASDVTYTATWTVNKYTFTFDSNGGSPVESLTQDYGTSVASPEAPVRDGYTFAGWDKDIPSAMPASDMTFTASWTINQYKVRFVVDGTAAKEETLDYGSAIVAPADPEKEGYTFTGWNPAFVEGATVPASDVTYTATWTVNTYKLTYYLNDKEVLSIEKEYGSTIDEYVPDVETGYQFDGWTDEIPATMPAHDLEIHGTTSVLNGVMSVFAGGVKAVDIYTYNGQLFMKDAGMDAIMRLPSGLYLIGGRKYLKK